MEVGLTQWIVELAVEHDAIPYGPHHVCPYLPDRTARERAFISDAMDGLAYHRLMEHGYRRSGTCYYKTACTDCHECVPIRVPVSTFRPSRSQRRAWRRNADLRVELAPPTPSRERHALFQKYLDRQHDGSMSGDYDDFCRFLYESQVDTLEATYWLGRDLVGVGILDVCSESVSSVYFYFDPDHGRRSLGVFSTLWEIDYARRRDIPYYYLGYYIDGARTMSYKARFSPHERRLTSGQWRRFDGGNGETSS